MSAQLTSFEGPDVQLLLDRIRTELGPDAKINGAEKIRVGGVLGFFAKEHYRVVVETPGTADAPLPSITEGLSDSIETSGAVSTSRRTTTSDVFSAMADATDDVNEVASASVTTSPTPLGTTSAQAHAVAGVPTTDAVAESFDDVLWRVATTLEPDPGASNGHDALTASADDFAGGAAAVGEPVLSAGDEHSGAAPDIASKAAQFLAATVVPPDGAGGGGGGGTGASAADTMVAALHRVGLGASMVHQLSEGLRLGGDLETLLLETLLLEAFGGLTPPPPLPRRAGSLLVVVGAGVPARRLGAALAGELGTDPVEVPFCSRDAGAYAVVTGKLLVRSAEDAAELAPGWRRSQPAVVVVDAPVAAPERSWASHLIAALRPTAVWGVVDATAKTEDTAAWVQALGGMDALALENLDATVSPAAALGLGIPVARIDGQPATAARWVATIVDRVDPWV